MASSDRRRRRELPPDTDLVDFLLSLPPEAREEWVRRLGFTEADSFDRDWPTWAHDGQRPPAKCPDGSDWSTCVVMGGRGFGKTRAGSEWIVGLVAGTCTRTCPPPDSAMATGTSRCPLRIALVGATLAEARRVMVEGPSGLLEVAGPWIREWRPSLDTLKFRTGAVATLFSGHSPEILRGSEHDFAWCDELAKWEKAQESWDMLQLGLRVGDHPRVLVTTTPRPGPVLRSIMAEPDTVVIGGPTAANPHTSARWRHTMAARYAGTRLARQELDGELLTDNPGALWTVELLEKCRLDTRQTAHPEEAVSLANRRLEGPAEFTRIVIGVDPPAGDGTCGIIACARDEDGIGHVLADHSVTALSPEGWSRAVADSAAVWGRLHEDVPVLIVAEKNQGGNMVETVLRIADPELDVKLVFASPGKTIRAEPVARLFEAGEVVLHGRFPALEAQLCGMIAGGGYEGPGRSPDRADAMVWALTELMLTRQWLPRITRL